MFGGSLGTAAGATPGMVSLGAGESFLFPFVFKEYYTGG